MGLSIADQAFTPVSTNPGWSSNSVQGVTVTTTTLDGVTAVGPWVQLRLPFPLSVKSFTIGSPPNVAQQYNQYLYVLGSTDGNSWYTIHYYPSPGAFIFIAGPGQLINFNAMNGANANKAYTYLRMVIFNNQPAGSQYYFPYASAQGITFTGAATFLPPAPPPSPNPPPPTALAAPSDAAAAVAVSAFAADPAAAPAAFELHGGADRQPGGRTTNRCLLHEQRRF